MDVSGACKKAEELVNIYNPEGVVPFPFDRIVEAEKSIKLVEASTLPEKISGAIVYDSEINEYIIFINETKNAERQYFTIAHELGHYYLHQEFIKREKIIVEDNDQQGYSPVLYRDDNAPSSEMEREANNFAATLIMPESLVRKAWEALKDIEECAKIFKVSSIAMSIRLERLKLVR